VKEAGGNVDGVLRFTIQWNDNPGQKDVVDFDAHAHEPNGTHIYYSTYKGAHSKTPMTGHLDVDMIRPSNVGIENITWTDISKMQEGKYLFSIVNYDGGRNHGFSAQVEFDGQIFEFSKSGNIQGTQVIAEVMYSKKDGFSITSKLDPSVGAGKIYSKERWGVATNKFQKVTMVMNSPNHWDGKPVGNKHVFFIVEGAKNDEPPRGFYNEFLKEELTTNRKVFEVLGAKLKVEPSDRQLTGVGFSDTQRNSFIVRVEGQFKRTLKVTV
jgi:hypothetical protein